MKRAPAVKAVREPKKLNKQERIMQKIYLIAILSSVVAFQAYSMEEEKELVKYPKNTENLMIKLAKNS